MNLRPAYDESPLGRALERCPVSCTVVLYDTLPATTLTALLAHRHVASVVLAQRDDALAAHAPGQIGWHETGGLAMKLPQRIGDSVLYVGNRWTLTLGKLLALRAVGVKRLACMEGQRNGPFRPMAGALAAAALRAILFRASMGPALRLLKAMRGLPTMGVAKLLRLKLPPPGANNGPLIVVTGSLGPGGSERQVANTVSGLAADRARAVQLMHLHPMVAPNDFYLPQVRSAGVDVQPLRPLVAHRVNVLDAYRDRVRLLPWLAPQSALGDEIGSWMAEFVEARPAIVHTWLDHMNVTAGVAAVLCGVGKVVIGCRSVSPRHFALYQPYMRPLYRLLADCPQVTLLANSAAGAADYAAWLDLAPDRFEVVRNGFDFSILRRDPAREQQARALRAGLGIDADALVVTTVMRLAEEKRPDLWLEVAARVHAAQPAVRFVIAGDGPLRATLERACADLGLAGVVHFLGQRGDVDVVLCASSVFLLTSRVEGLPNVLIEAQACGVPVVAAAVGGAAETFAPGRTGLVAAPDTADGFAVAVTAVLNDGDLRDNARVAGPAWVTEHFSLARMLAGTRAAYASAAPRQSLHTY